MRGALQFGSPDTPPERFIPAHAGSTSQTASRRSLPTVHPRACGEHSVRDILEPLGFGSSPRMRGARNDTGTFPVTFRFIPAHAGSTLGVPFQGDNMSVHPRACGEHTPAPNMLDRIPGSSPRMRGALDERNSTRLTLRFIPAHAGSTCCLAKGKHDLTVHPRACGEHPKLVVSDVTPTGSSPRMRGARLA